MNAGLILQIIGAILSILGILIGIIGVLVSPKDNLISHFSGNNIINTQTNMGDTFNVSSNNQQGGITAGQINIGNNQRHLSDEDIKSLIESISAQNPTLIKITSNSNMESYQYAKDVQQFLVSKGYNVEGVYQTMLAGGPIGISTQSEGENIMGVYVN
ncbi:MAG: hypothetical protein ACD_80C00054G0002 [uncultured bacterium (gcode 4)]|uniref:Uncharacterized protein n=1 Tax=uncultured bacterium (gcode 4) TaxID=1234023 RepID=K1YJ71_9BACT|nr:MAG: hypothetical protein ACD_80C00054G0002 [uncultured bacterium (gcode 4)]KKS51945.1 MAG: hypothetical protein UV18_C0015G0013 [Candidatus Magasanikbacteria bacterium GW2011_GWC2_42_27]KKT04149.1 MAG: hypothetical protein UV82_C0011G0077 [Candidatus Magasanikbacteria bacterium GW2011_GWD2_43_18]KKT25673.1 MAG: hypothetical protein UW10_C0005G0040 [Candidatus Magasanikbacteria bacterium GW2011_GWA2_43_9]HBB38495.1 hypothetical protein [Candidatus Magasanikbacteria bacterium]